MRAVRLLLLGRQLPLEGRGRVLRPAREAFSWIASIEVAHDAAGEDAGALIALERRGNAADDEV